MCLAIAPENKPKNSVLSRLWSRVASTPIRLLSLTALAHTLMLSGLFLYDRLNAAESGFYAYVFGFVYGVVALIAFGLLLSLLPKKFSQSPVHYAQYGLINIFMMAGLGIVEAGLLLGNDWTNIAMLVLIPAWLLALQSIRNLHIWLPAEVQVRSRLLILLLTLNLSFLVLALIGQIVRADLLSDIAAASSALLVWPLALVASVALVLSAPNKVRVISL